MHKMRWRLWLACVGFFGSWALVARADVAPHALFSDSMVLQQGADVPVWGTADDGEKVTVTFQGQAVSANAAGGKWKVSLKPLSPGEPAEMTIQGKNTVTLKNVLVGEVWVCSGQSNMAMTLNGCHDAETVIARSANPKIRLFTVPRKGADEPQSEVDGSWSECGPDTVAGFSGVGYFFGKHLQEKLDVPVGLINSSFGGTMAEAWTSRPKLAAKPQLQPILDGYAEALKRYPEAFKRYEDALAKWKQEAAEARKEGKRFTRRAPRLPMGPDDPKRPSGLYYAMICPLQPFAVRGATWYQGEGNAGRAYQYRTLLPTMIECWREDWGQGNFPFLIVQLAPYRKIVDEPVESAWAELREAQSMTAENVFNTATAVITDVGEEDDIHPKKKQPVGDRLAIAARALAYGEEIEYSGPIYKSMEVREGKAILSFDHLGGGLVAKGGELTGFTICGEDRKFVNARATIAGDTVVVSSPDVPQPVAVRFGWADFPVVNLWNKADLPASPFRTDDFPGVTGP
ncbi:MAG: sialate O-acetylesterase [Planctomycetota bacterium]